jgi:hypothetical protein
MGLSFTIAAGLPQCIHFWVRVPWDSEPYFTVSDSRLHFLSPPTTRRATVKVFDPASTREEYQFTSSLLLLPLRTDRIENIVPNNSSSVACISVAAETCLQTRYLSMNVFSGNTIPAFRRHVTITSLTRPCHFTPGKEPPVPIL